MEKTHSKNERLPIQIVAAAHKLRIEMELKKFLIASHCLTTKTASKQVIMLGTSVLT
jgi:hypothetical protein